MQKVGAYTASRPNLVYSQTVAYRFILLWTRAIVSLSIHLFLIWSVFLSLAVVPTSSTVPKHPQTPPNRPFAFNIQGLYLDKHHIDLNNPFPMIPPHQHSDQTKHDALALKTKASWRMTKSTCSVHLFISKSQTLLSHLMKHKTNDWTKLFFSVFQWTLLVSL